MNAYEYLNALRAALSALPDEERDNAMRYYEDYFLDAGPENEARVIEELGAPEAVAAAILNDYREVVPGASPAKRKRGKPSGGMPVWAVVLLGLLALCGLPIAVPLGVGAVAVVIALLLCAVVLAFGGVLVAAAVPLALLVAGALVCVFAFFAIPHGIGSVLATLGAGLVSLALGGLLAMVVFKLLMVFSEPLFRLLGRALNGLSKLVHDLLRKGKEAFRR